jgi:hypothetical protein
MSLTEDEREQLRRLLSKVPPQERKSLLTREEVPRFWWNSNLMAFKAVLKKVESSGEIPDEDLVKFLQSKGLLKESATTKNYGYTYNETGIFVVDDSGKVSLTVIGEELAKLFDNGTELRPIEVVVCRGLQQQAAGYAYLNIVGTNPGIHREELRQRMEELYGGTGRYYTGYYTRIFKQLKLIRRTTDQGKAKYWLTVPQAWSGSVPEDESEEEG